MLLFEILDPCPSKPPGLLRKVWTINIYLKKKQKHKNTCQLPSKTQTLYHFLSLLILQLIQFFLWIFSTFYKHDVHYFQRQSTTHPSDEQRSQKAACLSVTETYSVKDILMRPCTLQKRKAKWSLFTLKTSSIDCRMTAHAKKERIKRNLSVISARIISVWSLSVQIVQFWLITECFHATFLIRAWGNNKNNI